MHALFEYTGYFIAGSVALNLALYMISSVVPKAAFAARCLAAYFALVICAVYGVLACATLQLIGLGQYGGYTTARAFKYTMALAVGVVFTVQDPNRVLETVTPCVYVSNHQSELDVCMLGAVFPPNTSITAKSSLRNTPFLGQFMVLCNTVFINRANSKDALQAMAGAAEIIRRKSRNVFIFAEGTRSYSKEPVLLPFKKGGFHLAVQAQVPIVPVVVANYSHILWIKGLVFRSGSIPVKILDPIVTAGLTTADVDHLSTYTRQLMLKELVVLTANARGKPTEQGAMLASAKNVVASASGIEDTLLVS